MKNIKIFKKAELDLISIAEYIAQDNVDAANKTIDRFYKLFTDIAAFSNMGSIPKNERIRNLGYRFVIADNYLIFYTSTKTEIQIKKVINGACNYEKLI